MHPLTLVICLCLDPNDVDAAEIDRQNISSRLQADAATHSTHIHDFVADRIVQPASSSTEHILACRGHRLTVTAAIVSPDCSSLWTAGKDGRIVRWRLRDGKMLELISKGTMSEEDVVAAGRQSKTNVKSGSSGAARRRARSQAALSSSARTATNGMANGMMSNGGIHAAEDETRCQLVLPQAGQGHNDEIWALAASQDGNYLVSGGKDRRICVWTPGKGKLAEQEGTKTSFLKALGGHKDSITGLRFRQGTHDLFSASSDRTLKLFDISQLSYVETFFGHQEEIAGLDVLRGELAVSAGSRDRTVRWWKVREESQLVFRGGAKSKVREVLEGGDIMDQEDEEARSRRPERGQLVEGSIDAVAMVDEHTFLSGGDTGTICLWSLSKKKPVFTLHATHGYHEGPQGVSTPRWITSLACLPYGDVFASGSWDGQIRLWKLSSNLKSFAPLLTVPAPGFVNALQLVHPSRSVVKRSGGTVVSPELWRRHGGLRGGAKKVFGEQGEQEEQDEVEDEDEDGGEQDDGDKPASTTGPGSVPLLIVAGVGQEPVRGRWLKIKEAQNGTLVVPLMLN